VTVSTADACRGAVGAAQPTTVTATHKVSAAPTRPNVNNHTSNTSS
jgi:hypothetical protein